MTVKFDWYEGDNSVGYYELIGNWTWEEVYQVMGESWAEISKVDATVDSIMMSKSISLPPGAMAHLRTLSRNRPVNTGILVVVGASVFQRSIIQVFSSIFSNTLHREVPITFADSVEEAYALLIKIKSERDVLM